MPLERVVQVSVGIQDFIQDIVCPSDKACREDCPGDNRVDTRAELLRVIERRQQDAGQHGHVLEPVVGASQCNVRSRLLQYSRSKGCHVRAGVSRQWGSRNGAGCNPLPVGFISTSPQRVLHLRA